ncbi:hypothetical protein [Mycolicibacterium holsaticum]|jgi:hypothetical protein|uniref:Proline rich protein n=1 Tax=Mycolicibacterium holsaticum TaxID=152142 RepID=A0A1E3S217_9MYCO|nr:hypothetical protein [Mycolicibacterium holsaticum]MDA4107407.1 hypothetical protein [Mycolicibacterium holsaticum DSM 44478 = JCM 12374]ODQ96148.1 hypothetical protein BHQ17_01935 [Mycolicibacterium holsaticum]QZA11196.1 hypothetical protein K3U96_18410 [Mycolicibacterium holsaticum DSM 44478 = JCM 12374]UNC11309.1 hypothetical protein H5U41_08420 [Mycolicibacterium holsaticum DSM 44478 = JCM 12374]
MAERRFTIPSHLFGGRIRTSTLALIAAFVAVLWLQQTYEPKPEPPVPATQFVPPGFVPDPNYTWVPRTNVRRPVEPSYPTTTTTTTPTTTTTTAPPTSPTEVTPTTTVEDPDGPGPLAPQTETVEPPPETSAPFAPFGPPVTTTAPPS